MKSKEELERLNDKLLRYDEHYDYNDMEIIKKDLDKLEKLEKIIKLILDKCVIELHIRISKNVEEYNKWNTKCFQLTQEEYDLLKEYLDEKKD